MVLPMVAFPRFAWLEPCRDVLESSNKHRYYVYTRMIEVVSIRAVDANMPHGDLEVCVRVSVSVSVSVSVCVFGGGACVHV
jgi:hypothetical protein